VVILSCCLILSTPGCDNLAVSEPSGTVLDEEGGDGVGDTWRVDVSDGQGDDVGAITDSSSLGDSSSGDSVDEIDLRPSGAGCVVVQPKRVDWVNPHPDRLEVYQDLVVFKTAAEFEEALGVAPPPEIAFPEEWAIILPMSNYTFSFVEFERLEFCPGQTHMRLHLTSATDCTSPGFELRANALFRMDALLDGQAIDGGSSSEETTYASCATEGNSHNELCDHEQLCQPELICVGLTEHLTGFCSPADHQGRVTNNVDVPIPDGDAIGVEIANTFVAVPGLVADVVVSVRFDHPSPRDLVVKLTSPSGTEAVLSDRESADLLFLERPAWGFEGSDPNGTWSLRVVDDELGNQGQVNSWAIAVTTRPQQ